MHSLLGPTGHGPVQVSKNRPLPKGTDMTAKQSVTVLGLGAMGSAITERLRETGYGTTVWNRTPAKTEPHVEAGSKAAATGAEAVGDGDGEVVLLDHAGVHERLAPLAAELNGKVLVNPVPRMIGGPGSRLLYSGDANAYDIARPALETLGAESEGEDPGLASLKDMAPLSTMELLFTGYLQAVAMMRTAGVAAVETAGEVEAWLAAMPSHGRGLAEIIDGGAYDTGGQNVLFTRASSASLITAGREQGVRRSAGAAEETPRRARRDRPRRQRLARHRRTADHQVTPPRSGHSVRPQQPQLVMIVRAR